MNVEISSSTSFCDKLDVKQNDTYVSLIGTVDEDTSKKFCENLLSLDKQNLDFIPVFIQSPGGDVDYLLMIMHTMEMCVTPICTVCMGYAASAAAVIFCMGSENMRIMGPSAYLMFHEYSAGIEGKGSDIACQNSHFLKIDKMINKKLEKHIGLECDFFDTSNDMFLLAKDALKWNIATHVGYPTINFNFSVEMSLQIKAPRRQETDESKRPYKYCKTSVGSHTSDI